MWLGYWMDNEGNLHTAVIQLKCKIPDWSIEEFQMRNNENS